MTNLVFVALFMGQGGWLTSQGVFYLRDDLRKVGARAAVYEYTDEHDAHPNILQYRERGYKIALWGFSLGTSAALFEQSQSLVDLLMCCAVSTLEDTWEIAPTTKRSVLWCGPGLLSSGGTKLKFNATNMIDMPILSHIPILGHLAMQVMPRVVDDTINEVRSLLQGGPA